MTRLGILLIAICTAVTALAQSTTAAAASSGQPDVAIFANVRARELRFDDVGTVNVSVTGDVNGQPAQVVSHSDRRNFPDPVQPHVIYRDIGMQLTITSTLPDIETIVDEALAPVAPPQAAAQKNPAPRKPPATRKKARR